MSRVNRRSHPTEAMWVPGSSVATTARIDAEASGRPRVSAESHGHTGPHQDTQVVLRLTERLAIAGGCRTRRHLGAEVGLAHAIHFASFRCLEEERIVEPVRPLAVDNVDTSRTRVGT